VKSIIKIILTAIAVVILAKFMPGVVVESYVYAIIVAIILSLLRVVVSCFRIFCKKYLDSITL